MGSFLNYFCKDGRGVVEEIATNVKLRYLGTSSNVNVDKAVAKIVLKNLYELYVITR